MKSWKPFLIRLFIFLFISFLAALATSFFRQAPQVTLNTLFAPTAFAVLLGAFILLKREELQKFKYTFSTTQALFFGAIGYAQFLFYIFQQNTIWNFALHIPYLLLGEFYLFAGNLLIFFAIFQVSFVKHFFKSLLILASTLIVYAITTTILGFYGNFLARLIIRPLASLLSLTNRVEVRFIDGTALLFIEDFYSEIVALCTGISSLTLFIGIFLFIVLLDWKSIDVRKTACIFLIGTFGMLLVAFIRLYVLFLIAGNWSPRFAMAAFHTNAGLVFFVIYFSVFFWFMYPKMLLKTTNRNL